MLDESVLEILNGPLMLSSSESLSLMKSVFLEPITRKWMRAGVTAIDIIKKQIQVRLMDTGQQISAFFSLDNLIEWKNFDLSKIAARSIRYFLYNEESVQDKHETDICFETKFKFKDLTTNLSLKCVIVEPLNKKNENVEEAELQEEFNEENDQQLWIVKLYKQEILDLNNKSNNIESNIENVKTKESQSINRCVIKFNRDEKNSNNEYVIDKYSSFDIRFSEGKFVSKKIMIKMEPDSKEVIETENPAIPQEKKNAPLTSSILSDLVETKPEEAKNVSSSQLLSSNSLPYLYRGAYVCSNEDAQNKTELIVNSNVAIYNMDQSDEKRFCPNYFNQEYWSDRIQAVISSKNITPFSNKQQKRPTINSRCFVNVSPTQNKLYFKRGIIEHIYYDLQKCDIRFL
jgi:hypothetical protein